MSVIGGVVAIVTATLGLLLALGVIEPFGSDKDATTATTSATTPTTSGDDPGPEEDTKVAVSDVVGASRDDAEDALQEADLVPTAVEEPSADVAEDRIVRTQPGAGTRVDPGTDVRLVVSTGPPTPKPDIALFLTSCSVVPRGSLSGADLLNLNIRVTSQGQVPFDGRVQVVARSDTGLASPDRNITVMNTPASVALQIDLAGQDYGKIHRFTITADADMKVDESDEVNNEKTVDIRLPSPRPTSTFYPC